jgi:hypothetical protein
MEPINVNGQRAIQIKGKLLRETLNAYLLDCDGDQEWFPKNTVRVNHYQQTIDIQEWIFKIKFPKG